MGVTRIVILTSKYAIKIPRIDYGWMKFIEGIYSNLSEHNCWINVKNDKLLCPTLYSFGGLFNVMPRIKICETEEEIKSIRKVKYEDRKPINYGYYNGRIVCVDYPYHRIKLENRLK